MKSSILKQTNKKKQTHKHIPRHLIWCKGNLLLMTRVIDTNEFHIAVLQASRWKFLKVIVSLYLGKLCK